MYAFRTTVFVATLLLLVLPTTYGYENITTTYYSFNGSGSTLTDYARNNDGALGGATRGAGYEGAGLVFNGTTAYPANQSFGNVFSVTAWINLETLPGIQPVATQASQTTTAWSLGIQDDSVRTELNTADLNRGQCYDSGIDSSNVLFNPSITDALQDGDKIFVGTRSICAGNETYREGDGTFSFPIFPDDTIGTPSTKDGMESGDPYVFTVYRPSTGTELRATVTYEEDGPLRDSDGEFTPNTLVELTSFEPVGDLTIPSSSPDNTTRTAGTLSPDWNHVALTYNGTDATTYLNGNIVDTFQASGTLSNEASGSLQLGNNDATPDAFEGRIDEFTLHEAALSPQDVSSIYTAGVFATPQAPTPTITPASLTTTNTSLQVTITNTLPESTTYYTVDGTEPTQNDAEYTAPITLTNTATVTARTYAEGYISSNTSQATYTFNTAPVADAGPDATVQTGTNTTLNGTLSDDADGIITAQNWTQVVGPAVPIERSETLTAYFTPSTAGTYEFTLQVTDNQGATDTDLVSIDVLGEIPPPTITPANLTGLTAPVEVTIANAFPSTTTYYTTDNSSPTETSTTYDEPVTVETDTVIRAASYRDGFAPSPETTSTYVFNTAPVADAGPDQEVNVSDTVVLDGTNTFDTEGIANQAWLQIGGPAVTSDAPTALNNSFTPTIPGAYQWRLNVTDTAGETSTDTVTITAFQQATPPTISPSNETVRGGIEVTMNASPNTTIHYTTNGTTPTNASPTYTEAITLSETTTINALATGQYYYDSAVTTKTYIVTEPDQPPTITFNPSLTNTSYQSGSNITINATIKDPDILTEINVTTPSTNSTYASNESFTYTETLTNTSNGTYTVEVSVKDALNYTATKTATFNVTDTVNVSMNITDTEITGSEPLVFNVTPTPQNLVYDAILIYVNEELALNTTQQNASINPNPYVANGQQTNTVYTLLQTPVATTQSQNYTFTTNKANNNRNDRGSGSSGGSSGGSSSSGGGGGFSGGGGSVPRATQEESCSPDVECDAWTTCTDGEQTRTCTDKNRCEEPRVETRSCTADDNTTELTGVVDQDVPIVLQNPRSEGPSQVYTTSIVLNESSSLSFNRTTAAGLGETFTLRDGQGDLYTVQRTGSAANNYVITPARTNTPREESEQRPDREERVWPYVLSGITLLVALGAGEFWYSKRTA